MRLAMPARRLPQSKAVKAPTEWAPFKGKDDTLAYLNYAVGFLTLKTAPDQAIDSLLKAARYESEIKKTPSTYYFLAVGLRDGSLQDAFSGLSNRNLQTSRRHRKARLHSKN